MGVFAVTGASGFIGSVLCKRLKEDGHKVITTDITDVVPAYTDEHHFTGYSSPEFLGHILNERVGAVFHLAAHSLIEPSRNNPIPYFLNNSANLANVIGILAQINKTDRPKLICSSSAAVYASSNEPVTEDSKLDPSTNYGMSKLHAEQILSAAYYAYDIPSVSFRFFNVAGAWEDTGQAKDQPHVLTTLCNSAKNKQPFNLNGNDYNTPDGSCVRDYVHVRDIVEAHILALDLIDKNPGATKYNLGSNKGTSLLELIKEVETVSGEEINVNVTDRRVGDPDVLIADSTKFREDTGYSFPHSNINEIVESHWNYIKERT